MAFLGLFGKSKIKSQFKSIVAQVNALEAEIQALSPDELRAESKKLQFLVAEDVAKGTSDQDALNKILPRAFALVREAAKRTLGQRHFDVQIMGGFVLHNNAIAEMRTGEGKTLVATLPVYLNALLGKGVHVVTVNEYLAKRDADWMGQVYHALGLTVSCLVHGGALQYDPAHISPDAEKLVDKERDTTGSFLVQKEYLKPIDRKAAYECDITHGTNHEFGFDYLRDNLAQSKQNQVQRGHYFAVIDEVDSILIDEARTPLIIAAPDNESSQAYKTFARIVARLEKGVDYVVDEKDKGVQITDEGINKVEQMAGVKELYAPENLRLTHYLQESLRAYGLFVKDRDYIVKGDDVVIVDQFTGRLMQGRRFSGGLHQAIEAKEGVLVQNESKTYAQISIQNYFRLYKKLAGMTGTAQTSAEEFHKVYKLEVETIPTNRQLARVDMPDLIYKTVDAKYDAIVKDVKERNAKGQPVLIGTVSIEKNEELSRRLSAAGLKHEMLNAKNNEREGAIIAQAGKKGGITVATNMAGRGVDIILGGNPPEIKQQQEVRDLGGLHVIGTERHDSRRIDNQLRGRAGRQGDPGSSQFFLSMEDDLMRIFGGDRMKGLMTRLNLPDDMPIQAGILTRSIGQAQSKVEGRNFDARKHLLEYDDVLNKQRLAIYRRRQEMIESGVVKRTQKSEVEGEAEVEIVSKVPLGPALAMLDTLWMGHLENMDALQESVRLRSVGQHDPLIEYRREGRMLYQDMLAAFDQWLIENEDRFTVQMADQSKNPAPKFNLPSIPDIGQATVAPGDEGSTSVSSGSTIGRNDPCSCGSGKKYKKCHGK